MRGDIGMTNDGCRMTKTRCWDFGLHSPFAIRHSSFVPATLASLRIRNLALVEELAWTLAPGFVAVTGETGSGKSIDRADERLVAVERLAGVVGDDFRDHADAGQNEHVHLGMREEPEKVLPEDRSCRAGRGGAGRARD